MDKKWVLALFQSDFLNMHLLGGMLGRTTHFTGYLSDAGFELGRAISGNRESLKKVSFCYIVMGLSFLDMRHEVYKYEKK